MILKTSNALLKDISTDLIILNNARNAQLLDSVTDRDHLRGSPKKTVKSDATDEALELGHVGLIIPGLDVQDDGGLGDDNRLLGLLGLVLGKAGGLGGFSLGVLLLVFRAEEVEVVVLLGRGSRGSRAVLGGSLLGSAQTRENCTISNGKSKIRDAYEANLADMEEMWLNQRAAWTCLVALGADLTASKTATSA